jgi:hypothetical protein
MGGTDGIMEERKRAWRKREKKNAESAEISGLARQAGVNLSTFSPASPPSSSTASDAPE